MWSKQVIGSTLIGALKKQPQIRTMYFFSSRFVCVCFVRIVFALFAIKKHALSEITSCDVWCSHITMINSATPPKIVSYCEMMSWKVQAGIAGLSAGESDDDQSAVRRAVTYKRQCYFHVGPFNGKCCLWGCQTQGRQKMGFSTTDDGILVI